MSKIKQALRKFPETAKGWYWNKEKLFRSFALKKTFKKPFYSKSHETFALVRVTLVTAQISHPGPGVGGLSQCASEHGTVLTRSVLRARAHGHYNRSDIKRECN